MQGVLGGIWRWMMEGHQGLALQAAGSRAACSGVVGGFRQRHLTSPTEELQSVPL